MSNTPRQATISFLGAKVRCDVDADGNLDIPGHYARVAAEKAAKVAAAHAANPELAAKIAARRAAR